jgi:DNA modification methylase
MTPALTPVLAQHIELWQTARLVPYARNARTHSDQQVAQIAASIVEFGFVNPILVDSNAGIIAGHGRLLAARKLGLAEVPVVVLDHLNETQRRAYILADNKIALNAGWDDAMLAEEVRALQSERFDLDLAGFSDEEIDCLLAVPDVPETAPGDTEEIPVAPVLAVTRPGDLWILGGHRLVCGDCRDLDVVTKLLDPDKKDVRQIQMCITSPPYAAQREYDSSSGFRPIPADEYAAWYRDVAGNIAAILVDDGSYFLNIKEHADDGERSLYVKDLVIAHRRQWGWRFVDEFCWRKTDNGVPGGWGNRFKNAWEPVFHFCRQQQIKFRPKRRRPRVGGLLRLLPEQSEIESGSGLLGTGAWRRRGFRRRPGSLAAHPQESEHRHQRGGPVYRRRAAVQRGGGEVGVRQGSHSAPFPRALVEFFLFAFSDPGDVVYDPFMGSGTTMAAAHLLDRVGCGCELSPAYCDVILRRMVNLGAEMPVLAATGQPFAAVAQTRGVPVEQALNPKERDSRAIKHNGPNPFYGTKRKAS